MNEEKHIVEFVNGPASLEYGGYEILPHIMPVMKSSFLDIYGESWNEQQCSSMLSLPGTKLLIARIDKNICGFAFSRMVLDEEELLMIAVAPEYQNRSVGRQLLEQILSGALQNAGIAVFLEVRSNNNARKLYQQLGFEEIGVRKEYYTGSDRTKYDAITYKKLLLNNN